MPLLYQRSKCSTAQFPDMVQRLEAVQTTINLIAA